MFFTFGIWLFWEISFKNMYFHILADDTITAEQLVYGDAVCKLTAEEFWNIWITTFWLASFKNRVQTRILNQKMFNLW